MDKLEANVTFQVRDEQGDGTRGGHSAVQRRDTAEANEQAKPARRMPAAQRRRSAAPDRTRRPLHQPRIATAVSHISSVHCALSLSSPLLLSSAPLLCSARRVLQIKNGSYDAESNRELLKLYAIAPDMLKPEVLSRLLLKALMELPAPEFTSALYLLPAALQSSLDSVKFLCKLHALLDTCAFKKFWSEVSAWRAVQSNAAQVNFAEVSGFDSAVRRFITVTLAATYSTISSQSLKELWNLSEKKAFEEAVAAAGWSLIEDGKAVAIRAAPSAASAKEGSGANAAAGPQRTEQPSMEQLAKLITAQ